MAPVISLFGGSGFLGTHWRNLTQHEHTVIPREQLEPASHDSLYMISTTNNYHVFDAVTLDAETNIIRLLKTLRAVKQPHTFNFISSWFVYGKCNLPASEETPCDPRGFYSITKRAAEQLLISYCETHGISWRILRLANLYGPGDKFSAKKNALTHLIGELAANRDISIYWGGKSFRDYMHVTDAVRAIDLCLAKAPMNKIINVGTGMRQQFGDLMDEAKEILGSSSKITAREPTEFHTKIQTRDFWLDVSQLTDLGFHPQVSMRQGLEELCQLARSE